MSVDIHTLSGAYALNSVNDLERVAFDRHMAECDTCAQEVGELVATVTRLTDTTWSVAPPSLREKVLQEVSQTRQVRPGAGRRGGAATQRRWRTWAGSVAAAAVLVVASVGGTYLAQEDRVRDQRNQVVAEQQRLAAIERVLGASDVKLRRSPVPGGGAVSVAVSGQQNTAVATVEGMRAPLAGRCYQFWRMGDSEVASAGLFPAGQANGSHLIPGVEGYRMVGVTEEPCTGSAQPTRDPIATVALA
jgi:hypothetical protein